MKQLRDLSIKYKILLSFGLVLGMMVLQGWFSVGGMSHVKDQVDTVTEDIQPAVLASMELSSALEKTTAALGMYLLNTGSETEQAYSSSLSNLSAVIDKLMAMPAVANKPETLAKVEAIQYDVTMLAGYKGHMVNLAENENINIGAIGFAGTTLNPINRELLHLSSMMVNAEVEEDLEEERKEMLAAMNEMRFKWASVMNEVRLFMAFRTESALDNAKVYIDAVRTNLNKIKGYEDYLSLDQADAVENFEIKLDEFDQEFPRLIEIHSSEKWRSDLYLIRTEINPLINKINTQVADFIEIEQKAIVTATGAVNDVYEGQQSSTFTLLTLALALIAALAWLLVNGINKPLGLAVNVANRIARGDLNNPINKDAKDETGRLLAALDAMQTGLRERIDREAKVAAANSRIKTALDNVATNVMVADSDYNIIYMNKSLETLFQEIAPDLKKALPRFDPDNLVGVNIDIFHKSPAHQRGILDNLKSQYTADLPIGERTLRIMATPVFEDGQRLGTAVEWQDLTESLRIQQEKAEAEAAERAQAQENMRIRVALDNVGSAVMVADSNYDIIYMNHSANDLFKGNADAFRKDLPNFDANSLIGTNIDVFHKDPSHQRRLLDGLNGNYSAEMLIGGRTMGVSANTVSTDDGDRLGIAVEWVDRTQEVAVEQEVQSVVAAAKSGDLSQSIGLNDKDGFFLSLAEEINDLIAMVSGSFEDVSRVMGAVADGDLSRSIERDYDGIYGKVKTDINTSIMRLQSIVGSIRDTSGTLQGATGEIVEGNNSLSARTDEQASNLEQTASSMEEITSTVRNNADNAQQANQLAADARSLAEKGGEVVRDAVDAMAEINESSNRIAEIIGVIDEIAFQTNLLALNASVEAARAGEQGRGFAVVATEVRNLAQRSATAAKEIKELIQDSVTKVEGGRDLVNTSGETLGDIVSAVKKVGDIISEIAAASQEQTAGIEQINRAITNLDEMTQQNAALAEETSAASVSMSEEVQEMQKRMEFFRGGNAAVAMAPARAAPAAPARAVAPKAAPAPAASIPATAPAPAMDDIPPPPLQTDDGDEWDEF